MKVSGSGEIYEEAEIGGVTGQMEVMSADLTGAKVAPSGEIYKEEVIDGVTGRMPVVVVEGGGGAITVHNSLTDREADDCHPISAITGLEDALTQAGSTTVEDLSAQIDGANLAFTTSADLTTNAVSVFLNGVRLTQGRDYTIAGDVITLLTPAPVSTGTNPDALIAEISKKNVVSLHNNAGQIKANYGLLTHIGFTNGTPVTMPIHSATVSLSPPPTTIFPYNSPNSYEPAMLIMGADPINTARLREHREGQPHRWRFIGTYTGKAGGNNGQLQLRLRNPDSGFVATKEITLPTGLTSGDFTFELSTIADIASMAVGRGYVVEVLTSFTDASLAVTINSITRFSEAVENI